MALSNDIARSISVGSEPETRNDLPIASGVTVYQGSFVGLTSGYARALVARDAFAGISEVRVTETLSQAGSRYVRVFSRGILKNVSVTGASGFADVGKQVYASDDTTLTLAWLNNTPMGHITRYDPASATFDVYFSASSLRSHTGT